MIPYHIPIHWTYIQYSISLTPIMQKTQSSTEEEKIHIGGHANIFSFTNQQSSSSSLPLIILYEFVEHKRIDPTKLKKGRAYFMDSPNISNTSLLCWLLVGPTWDVGPSSVQRSKTFFLPLLGKPYETVSRVSYGRHYCIPHVILTHTREIWLWSIPAGVLIGRDWEYCEKFGIEGQKSITCVLDIINITTYRRDKCVLSYLKLHALVN